MIVQKDRKERSGMILPERQARTQQLEQDSGDGTTGLEQSGQDSYDSIVRTSHLRYDNELGQLG